MPTPAAQDTCFPRDYSYLLFQATRIKSNTEVKQKRCKEEKGKYNASRFFRCTKSVVLFSCHAHRASKTLGPSWFHSFQQPEKAIAAVDPS